MQCRRCPHFVRHGKAAADGKSIEFRELCGLKMKTPTPNGREDQNCTKHPFDSHFDYMACDVYISIFKSGVRRNDVLPTQDFQFSEALTGNSITDMELL